MDEVIGSELDNSRSCLELWIESEDIYGFTEALEHILMYLENRPNKRFYWENDRNKVFGRITDRSLPLESIVKQFGFDKKD